MDHLQSSVLRHETFQNPYKAEEYSEWANSIQNMTQRLFYESSVKAGFNFLWLGHADENAESGFNPAQAAFYLGDFSHDIHERDKCDEFLRIFLIETDDLQ